MKVSLSSLNRHAVATRDDVGIPKALCLKKHFSSIFPECKIDAKVQLYDDSSEEEILSGQPDFVLDCIDNIDTKVTRNLMLALLVIARELISIGDVYDFILKSTEFTNMVFL